MTQAALERRVRKLQKVFKLEHWIIKVKVVERCAGDNEDAAACVLRSGDYDMAEIQVTESTLATHSPHELDVTISHELMHIHFRDLDEVTGWAMSRLDEKDRIAFHAWMAHEQEGIVDRIARVVTECRA